jgi:hypothetical protein
MQLIHVSKNTFKKNIVSCTIINISCTTRKIIQTELMPPCV